MYKIRHERNVIKINFFGNIKVQINNCCNFINCLKEIVISFHFNGGGE